MEEILLWIATAVVSVITALFLRSVSHGRTGSGTPDVDRRITEGIDGVEEGIAGAQERVSGIEDGLGRVDERSGNIEDKLGRAKEILQQAHKEREP